MRTIMPLDPDCPGAVKIQEWAEACFDDPMTQHYGAGDVVSEMLEEREREHRRGCARCREFGVANIDVER